MRMEKLEGEIAKARADIAKKVNGQTSGREFTLEINGGKVIRGVGK